MASLVGLSGWINKAKLTPAGTGAWQQKIIQGVSGSNHSAGHKID